ncbi:TniQ family protein [Streptosporangium sp. NBC_01469]|uniref:TniQ family protein n=1 Tax=Streptosporangium sp. NBC_01469 TaxID=2903898 RepID=UPI002E2AA505|nr:TniQ family protein [Streptosporangium sp. NBC_01469]
MKTALRPLPRTVAPFPNETLTSYLNRLSRANRLDDRALRSYLAESHRESANVPVERLAALSGIPARTLRYAIVELCSADELDILGRSAATVNNTMACWQCTLTRGHREAVWCWQRYEEAVCLRHRRWTGPGTIRSGSSQPDLTYQPEILQAAKRHRRLIRRHGKKRVDYAYREAETICTQWHKRFSHDDGFSRRMTIFHGEKEVFRRHDPTIYAATYPQVIALTRILASPYWQAMTLENLPFPHRFIAEVQRTVASDYIWPTESYYGHFEPLADWINEQLRKADGPNLFDYWITERLRRSNALDDEDPRTDVLEQKLLRAGVLDGPSRHAYQLAEIIQARARTQSPRESVDMPQDQ